MRFSKIFLFFLICPLFLFGQKKPAEEASTVPQAAEKIEVKPLASDVEIQKRVQNILEASGWFRNSSVDVKEGIVFLYGWTRNDEYKKWAGNLARNTENVVAVVNNIEVEAPVWDFTAILNIFYVQGSNFIRALPSVIIGIVILIFSWFLGRLGAWLTRTLLKNKIKNALLLDVIGKTFGVLIFLIGVYLIFEIANLTRIALTIISGTGLLGIILGIAFKDITENFLASILLSIQNPFRTGDLIEIGDFIGYVQSLTMRVTLLMSLDGNHIQIPNSVVYKSNIRNYSSNPNRREEFIVGIGYDDTISTAQEVALKVLEQHEAVLKDPEPWVLVDSLGKATIILKVYFWIDGSQFSWLKVKSSVIRLVKRAFQEAGISMPDEAREVLFPKGINVQLLEPEKEKEIEKPPVAEEPDIPVTEAESGLKSEAEDIKEQSEKARPPESGKDFLEPEQGPP